jgi:hypothetical protein
LPDEDDGQGCEPDWKREFDRLADLGAEILYGAARGQPRGITDVELTGEYL